MTLQTSGAISLYNVNLELGRAGGAAVSLGEAGVRSLAEVASGQISMSNLYGKSNLQIVTFDNSGGAWGTPQDWDLWNVFVFLGISVTAKNVRVVLTNITISATSTGGPALQTGTGWPAGTNLEVFIGSGALVVGKGGAGGAGTTSGGAPGGAGGPAMRISGLISGGSITVNLNNQGLVYAGGGGGGGGGEGSTYTGGDGASCNPFNGGTGGTGYGPGANTGGGAGAGGSAGAGGTGGGAGAAGAAGGTGNMVSGCTTNIVTVAPGAGGAAGSSIQNSGWASIINYSGRIAGAFA